MYEDVFAWINAKLGAYELRQEEKPAISERTPEDWETIVSHCDDGSD